MYHWIYRKLLYPAYHRVIGSGASDAIRALEAHDHLSAEELQSTNRTKLRDLLHHAGTHVPYYRDVIDALGCSVDELVEPKNFAQLPMLTKDIIRRQDKRLTSENLDNNRLDANSTSGSTGSPLHFFTDTRSKTWRKATVVRNRRWLGIKRGDRIVNLWGSPIDQARVSAWRGRLHSYTTRIKFLSAYSLSDADMERYVQTLHAFAPKMLVGYPSVLAEFARFCARRQLSLPELRAIICSAEALFPEQREVIESVFATPVFNRYGCREVGDIAHERPGQEGLVVNSDRILVEIVDNQGQLCEPGTSGEMLMTDLDNYGMPLIRYRIGDVGRWLDPSRISADIPYPVLESVEGRSMDVVVSPSGQRVGGTFWTILFRKRPGIALFQVVQDRADHIAVRYVQDPDVEAVDTEYFRGKIHEKCGTALGVTFQQVDAIEADPTGKRRLVLSQVAANAGNNEAERASSV